MEHHHQDTPFSPLTPDVPQQPAPIIAAIQPEGLPGNGRPGT